LLIVVACLVVDSEVRLLSITAPGRMLSWFLLLFQKLHSTINRCWNLPLE